MIHDDSAHEPLNLAHAALRQHRSRIEHSPMTHMLFVLLTVLGIGFLIFIHEAGHYICARIARV